MRKGQVKVKQEDDADKLKELFGIFNRNYVSLCNSVSKLVLRLAYYAVHLDYWFYLPFADVFKSRLSMEAVPHATI